MRDMELIRPSMYAVFLAFLLLTASSLSLSTGRSSAEEVYEIDYKGPETHSSSFPPPNHHNSPWFRRHLNIGEPTSRDHKKTLQTRHKVRKIHG